MTPGVSTVCSMTPYVSTVCSVTPGASHVSPVCDVTPGALQQSSCSSVPGVPSLTGLTPGVSLPDISLPNVPSDRLALQKYMDWIQRQQAVLHRAGLDAAVRLAELQVQDTLRDSQLRIESLEQQLSTERQERKVMAQDNRRMKAELSKGQDLARDVYIPRDEVVDVLVSAGHTETYRRRKAGWTPGLPQDLLKPKVYRVEQ